MSSKVRQKIFGCGIALLALAGTHALANDVDLISDQVGESNKPTQLESVTQAVVHSARMGEIDADTPIYHTYTNAELEAKLERFHLIPADERRAILLEVNRRIGRDGHFKVEKNERSFGQVVRAEPESSANPVDEPRLEEIVIVRADATAAEEEEAVRRKEVRKTRSPVNISGRAYSSQ